MATQKQLRVARIISEKPRKSVSSAMREAGYSSRSAEKPQELTRSKGWQELMDKHLPDETLLNVHKGLLKNHDWRAREAGLDKAYKLKGSYKATKVAISDPFADLSDEELDLLIAERQPIIDRFMRFSTLKNNRNVK
ncbi:MAG: hypothetical protein WC734_03805 [Patescibacteria group bacterium]